MNLPPSHLYSTLPEGNYRLLEANFEVKGLLRNALINTRIERAIDSEKETERLNQEEGRSSLTFKDTGKSFVGESDRQNIDSEESLPFNLCQYKAAHNSFDKGRLRDQLAFSRETPGKGGCLCVELDLVQGV